MRINTTFLYFFAFTVVCFSCNDDKDETPQLSSNMNNTRQLKDDVTKYPDSLLLIEKLIQHYRDSGAYDSAIAFTDHAIARVPNVAKLWEMKAALYFENEDTSAAIKSIETAINISPLPEYVISLATLYAQTKNEKALVFANALAAKAKAKEAFFIKGLYYNYTGDKKKAITLFDSCIRLDYTYMFAYREKAIALYDEKKYEEAIIVLTRAVTIQNNFDEGYYWMGNCYKKLNKKEKAIRNYQTALMYDKNFIEARDSLKTLE